MMTNVMQLHGSKCLIVVLWCTTINNELKENPKSLSIGFIMMLYLWYMHIVHYLFVFRTALPG